MSYLNPLRTPTMSVPVMTVNQNKIGVASNGAPAASIGAPLKIGAGSNIAQNKNPRTNVSTAAATHIAGGNTNGSITRAQINTATQNKVSHAASLLSGNAHPNTVIVSGLNNVAMPAHTTTQYVKLVGQGINVKA